MLSLTTANPTHTIEAHLLQTSSVARRAFRLAEKTAFQRCTTHFPGNRPEQIRQFPISFNSAVIDMMDKAMTEGLEGNGCAQELIRNALSGVDWSHLCDVYRESVADHPTAEDALTAFCQDQGIE